MTQRSLLSVAAVFCFFSVAGVTCHRPRPARDKPASAPTPVSTTDDASSLFRAREEVQLPDTATAMLVALHRDREPGERIWAERSVALARERLADPGLAADELGRVRWLLARACEALEDSECALVALGALAESRHPLAPEAALKLGRQLLPSSPARSKDLGAIAARDTWHRQAEGQLLVGQAALQLHQPESAFSNLTPLLEMSHPLAIRGEAALSLGQAIATTPDLEVPESVRAQLIAALESIGQSQASGTFRGQAQRLLGQIRPRARPTPQVAQPSNADKLIQAESLIQRRRYSAALPILTALVGRRRFRSDAACEAGYLMGKVLLRQRERDAGARILEQASSRCNGANLQARMLFNAARARGRLGEYDRALTHYRAIESLAPSHRLADDARYKAALVAREDGDDEAFTTLLRSLPDQYPTGDMRWRARFTLAWFLRDKAGELEADGAREAMLREALALLDASVDDAPGETRDDLVGRSAYWRGRLLQALGDTAAASDGWRALTVRQPLSYYGWLAQLQLAKHSPGNAPTTVSACRGAAATPGFRLPRTAELEERLFEIALALFRVGEPMSARQALSAWRRQHPEAKYTWLEIALLHAAGAYHVGYRRARSQLAQLVASPPWLETGAAWQQARWRLAYPEAFSAVVQDQSQRTDIPPEFVWAVMREESAFDPRAASPADAFGLMQLIVPTASRFTDAEHGPVSGATLRNPETNIQLGTRFLQHLWGQFDATPFAIPAAYNAGAGAARRWLTARPDMAFDAWIEEIPYDETRRYSRRVLASYAVYRCLHGSEILWLTDEAQRTPGS